MFGFYRLAAASPRVKVADIAYNKRVIVATAKKADAEKAAAVLFPELAVTGYTCADLFNHELLLNKSAEAVVDIARKTKALNTVLIVGAPFQYCHGIYNVGFVIHQGHIKGIVPKIFNPNYREFYDKRWFHSGKGITGIEAELPGYKDKIPFGTDLLFCFDRYFIFGLEICEDLWSVIPPSSHQCLAGATVTFNLSASNELVSKADYRRQLVTQQSARCISAYVYTSAGVNESTTDLVFGGHSMVAENGTVRMENRRFHRNDSLIFADIDCARLIGTRLTESTYKDTDPTEYAQFRHVKLAGTNRLDDIEYTTVDPQPFVPAGLEKRSHNCQEIFSIQTAGLAKRFEHTGSARAVIGISGGLDSTMALLTCAKTFKMLGRPVSDIITVTMPGFGTTGRTYNNAVKMCELLGTELRKVDIRDVCLQHFKDIGHDPEIHDVTYENVQARERTQVLMDIANKERGLVIGTGDLSEIALGWSTYNGDHMSMYAVNCAVPKTLIRYLIQWVADSMGGEIKTVLEDIIATPVSPELLPNRPDNEIVQKTEELIGPYELHDFFLYHTVKYGAPPEKIKYLAGKAFDGKYDHEYISKYLKMFVRRFFTQQFKRSCIPDGPKVGTISLSPRGDWRMPSDASAELWLGEL
jgi:NAD+ synthase (glutamine-hydrolysing)